MFRISVIDRIYNIRKAFEKLAEGEVGGQKGSEVRPQGGHVYNYKALQRLAGEPAVLNSEFPWEPIFPYDIIQVLQFYLTYNSSKSLFEEDKHERP